MSKINMEQHKEHLRRMSKKPKAKRKWPYLIWSIGESFADVQACVVPMEDGTVGVTCKGKFTKCRAIKLANAIIAAAHEAKKGKVKG